jgi:hypothetical protein
MIFRENAQRISAFKQVNGSKSYLKTLMAGGQVAQLGEKAYFPLTMWSCSESLVDLIVNRV